MEDLGASLGVPNAKGVTHIGQQGYRNKQKKGEGSEKEKKKTARKAPKPAAEVHISNMNISTSKKHPDDKEHEDSPGIGDHVDVRI